ncbi:hypothetical protein OSB04_026093 [Centaurea solstitialis]|uniref:Starch synthase, chloroplastic/amyloplastic n=1 Tax=Centaurea solstitialis TaxID=347529 RepID=A0AA38VVA7_9ASTR|nr:hypothetical protein OSB04_026093 [Centaurea solstitialis]
MKTLLFSSPIFISKPTTNNITHKASLFSSQLGFSCCPMNINTTSNAFKLRVIRNNSKEYEDEDEDEDEDEEKDGLLLGAEKDTVAEFQLIPQSGVFEVGNFHDGILASKDDEESVDDELIQERNTQLTYNIVFVTSEASPYSKTGGLGDVCGSLPIALAARGHRVMVVSPRYLHGGPSDKKFAGATNLNCGTKVHCFGGIQEVDFYHEYRAGVDWVFVDHPSYHRPGNPYGDMYGAFGDNQFRFTLLCQAACEAPLVLRLGGFTYGEKCLFLANDWHAGLVPVLLAAKYRPNGVYKDARSIIAIHNLAHQWYGALEWIFPTWARTHALDTGQAVNILKGAIVTADRILTVSQGYSWEITTPEGGYGLNELLSSRKFVINGITNGIDVTEWDPSSDVHIASHYSVDDLSGKIDCKIALQKELGLPVLPDCPLVGFIGRLDYQKGIDILLSATPNLLQDDVQFIMLGSGEKQYEEWMRASEAAFSDRFRGWVGFNVPISHRITAGCDILLMPSRFEPCGLNQLYAMRYGTIPVVHGTGGLRDTVKSFNPFAEEGKGEGTGRLTSECTLLLCDFEQMDLLTIDKRMHVGFQYEQVFEWAFIDPPYVT